MYVTRMHRAVTVHDISGSTFPADAGRRSPDRTLDRFALGDGLAADPPTVDGSVATRRDERRGVGFVVRRLFEPRSVTGTSNLGGERRERRAVPAATRRSRAIDERRVRRRPTTTPDDHDPTPVDSTVSSREAPD
jgi:hypothetical protein